MPITVGLVPIAGLVGVESSLSLAAVAGSDLSVVDMLADIVATEVSAWVSSSS